MAKPRHAMQSKTLRATQYWTHANEIKENWNLIKYQNEIPAIEELHRRIMMHTMEAQKIIETIRELEKEI